ncbi:hypothetical protein [Capnocytophaga gingivalis]|uniref:hypothetical protein n=1 Tax=Capnocytophaga gingivalis TaxID=1017 RepID=UPI002889C23A|nr:hypothetical protein [Capnocytophaga gingivalis]
MESTVLYIKKYAIYSLLFLLFFECMMFLPCLGYQNKKEVLILFLIYQFNYLSLVLIFFILLILFRKIKKDSYSFFILFYSCFIFIVTIVDIIYHFGKQILNDETISIYSNEEVSKITFIHGIALF